jgi:hypothetical protein
MSFGWKCPNCGKAHGPHVQTCPEPAAPTRVIGTPYPSPTSVPRLPNPMDPLLPMFVPNPYIVSGGSIVMKDGH